ncbi:putative membrane protein [Actinocorallia herbida]|uniref:Putative membrane protein n=1 Tax=Actinocorallia herbida TaxID=58109 RepID=A0A3N1D138_9ACTN|nr:vitamin K epoxide reductase family protein [Actinocorallia herbida]ROO87220.1 putative membrane protein [Actinocorallia herbida]
MTTTADPGRDAAARSFAWTIALSGAVGLAVSAVLTLERIRLLENPGYRPSCNISPILSCGTVMKTEQAAAFGFPNPLLGLVAFAVVLTLGAVLLSGTALHRRIWLGLHAGSVAGLVFVHWLIFQTLYRIGAVCPYCVAIWIVTILLACVTAVRVRRLPPRVAWLLPVLWYLAIALLILNRFWFYWRTLL